MNNETSVSLPLVSNPHRIAIKVGALTATVLSFALFVLPILIISPDIGGYWPLVLGFSTALAAVSGIVGGIAGRLASETRYSAVGAILGIVVFVPAASGFSLFFVSSREPPGNRIAPFLFALIVGAVSGATSCIGGRRGKQLPRSLNHGLLDTATFIVLAGILVTWCVHESGERESFRRIAEAGGIVTWSAGCWDIRFDDALPDDAGFRELLPVLNRYVPLDLDLGNAKAGYEGLSTLRDLKHLIRLRLANGVLSDAEVIQLEKQLPDTEILIWKP